MKELRRRSLASACCVVVAGLCLVAQVSDVQIKWVNGFKDPEDLVAIPNSDWIVASGDRLTLINVTTGAALAGFPAQPLRMRLDSTQFPSCPGPSSQVDVFTAHGLNIRRGSARVHVLYVVHHGDRESIEAFEVDARGGTPILTWIGCVLAPSTVSANGVAPLPNGGIAVSSYTTRGDRASFGRLLSAQTSGSVWEWHPEAGWAMVPGSELSGPNGIEASSDGEWLYVSGWGTQTLHKLPRRQGQNPPLSAPTPYHIDNLRWQSDGTLIGAGQGGSAAELFQKCIPAPHDCAGNRLRVSRIDPNTLRQADLFDHASMAELRVSTAALQIGREIWVSGIGGTDRIARIPLP